MRLARLQFWALFLGLALVGAGTARAQLALYPFAEPNTGRTGAGFEATIVDPNATATDVSLSDGIPASNEDYIEDPPTGPLYGFPVLRLQPSTSHSDSQNPLQALANDKYFEFTVTANAGFGLYLTDLEFNAARGGSATPRGFVVISKSSKDGYWRILDQEDVPTVRNVQTPYAIDLSGSAFQNLPDITIRVYSYTPSTGQSVEYNMLSLNGFTQ
jgi:hypothetical protein